MVNSFHVFLRINIEKEKRKTIRGYGISMKCPRTLADCVTGGLSSIVTVMFICDNPQPKRMEDFSVIVSLAVKVEITFVYVRESPGVRRGKNGGTLHIRVEPVFVIVIFTVTFE